MPTDWLKVAHAARDEHGAVQYPSELAALLQLLAAGEPRIVLELGCDAGGTLWAWRQLPGPPEVIAVDSINGEGRRRAKGEPPDYHGAALIVGSTHDVHTWASVSAHLAGRHVDVLFIDADHGYDEAAKDYRWYGRFVRPGGLIVLHDIALDGYGAGVRKLWAELCETEKVEEYIDRDVDQQWGIGVVFTKGGDSWTQSGIGARGQGGTGSSTHG